MPKASFLLIATIGLLLPASAHAYCQGVISGPSIWPPGHVCGTVNRLGFNGSSYFSKPAGTTYVKICQANSTICTTTNTGSYSDIYGNQSQSFTFRDYRPGNPSYAWFDLYAWDDFYWGSSTKPIIRLWIGPGLEGIQINMPPRPLNPTPVYPSGNSVPDQYTVRWKSGRDLDRQPYPMTYEVWYKYWPIGGTEPSNWTLSRAGMPCNDDGSGPNASNECSTYVAGPQPAGNWKWYVVANLYVSWAGSAPIPTSRRIRMGYTSTSRSRSMTPFTGRQRGSSHRRPVLRPARRTWQARVEPLFVPPAQAFMPPVLAESKTTSGRSNHPRCRQKARAA
ncbi:MAG TPA: hypothetical protein VMW27_02870 [Thermoanaerobaculia bacterium]|nr:hypothetical protein [Thermoanaerobaculia bacterium]